MVALTIMAALITVAFAGLSAGLDSWSRGTKAIDNLDARAAVERLWKRQLAVAMPDLFAGSSTHVEFVADYSFLDGPSDSRKVDYIADGGRFSYGEQLLSLYVPSANESPRVSPVAQFSALTFRYLGQTGSGDLVWFQEWNRGTGLPIAVEIRAEQDRITIPLVNRK